MLEAIAVLCRVQILVPECCLADPAGSRLACDNVLDVYLGKSPQGNLFSLSTALQTLDSVQEEHSLVLCTVDIHSAPLFTDVNCVDFN